ncbi:GLPGLI family protein [Winogradskyella undariae]|uniref:GLPGLI family protein n=1 Tax=Winogradskyella undariae TaxID=1285465 RepID=UPI0015CC6DC3|nr:GLPGLI family protein [Winogradskyella undariae]
MFKKFIFLSLIVTFNLYSQNEGYEVIYGKKLIINDTIKSTDKKIRDRITSINKSLNDIEYVLIYNKDESYFVYDKKMDSDHKKINPRAITSGGMDGVFYTNFRTEIRQYQIELFDELFIVNDTINKYDWKLTGKTKLISNKLVYKAVTVVNVNDFRGNYNFNIEAWYCPEFTVQYGPASFSGLPGLVLEVIYDDKISTFIKSINKKKNIKIPNFSNGKMISQKELTIIFNQNMESIKNNN